LATFCWTKYFYIMMLILQGCCFIQSLHFCDKFQEDFVQDFKQCSSSSLAYVWTTWNFVWTLIYQSIIRPDDENFSSGRPSVSRSFELLLVAFIRTYQQYVWTPFSIRRVKRFLSKIKIWEDNCNRPGAILDKASRAEDVQPSRRQTPWFDAQTLLWKLHAVEVQPSGCGSIQERISSEFGKPIAQLSVRTPSATIRTPSRKIASNTI